MSNTRLVQLVTIVNSKMKIGFGAIKHVFRRKQHEENVVAFKNVLQNDSISVGQHLQMGKVQTGKKNYAILNLKW